MRELHKQVGAAFGRGGLGVEPRGQAAAEGQRFRSLARCRQGRDQHLLGIRRGRSTRGSQHDGPAGGGVGRAQRAVAARPTGAVHQVRRGRLRRARRFGQLGGEPVEPTGQPGMGTFDSRSGAHLTSTAGQTRTASCAPSGGSRSASTASRVSACRKRKSLPSTSISWALTALRRPSTAARPSTSAIPRSGGRAARPPDHAPGRGVQPDQPPADGFPEAGRHGGGQHPVGELAVMWLIRSWGSLPNSTRETASRFAAGDTALDYPRALPTRCQRSPRHRLARVRPPRAAALRNGSLYVIVRIVRHVPARERSIPATPTAAGPRPPTRRGRRALSMNVRPAPPARHARTPTGALPVPVQPDLSPRRTAGSATRPARCSGPQLDAGVVRTTAATARINPG